MRHASFLVASLLMFGSVATLSADDRGEWKPLFNGKNLDGWSPKITGYAFGENFGNTFRVEDGLIQVRYDKYDSFDKRFGHLFYKDKFSHYVIRVEYRFVGEQCKGGPGWAYRNNGIMFHCQDPKSMRKDQEFPVSIEAQLLGGNGKDRRTNLMSARREPISSWRKPHHATLQLVEVENVSRRPVGYCRSRGARFWQGQALRQWRNGPGIREAATRPPRCQREETHQGGKAPAGRGVHLASIGKPSSRFPQGRDQGFVEVSVLTNRNHANRTAWIAASVMILPSSDPPGFP